MMYAVFEFVCQLSHTPSASVYIAVIGFILLIIAVTLGCNREYAISACLFSVMLKTVTLITKSEIPIIRYEHFARSYTIVYVEGRRLAYTG